MDRLTAFATWLSAQGKTMGSVVQYVGALRPFFRYIEERGLSFEPLPLSELDTYMNARGLKESRRAVLRTAARAYQKWRATLGSPASDAEFEPV